MLEHFIPGHNRKCRQKTSNKKNTEFIFMVLF